MRLLIVEDDRSLATVLAAALDGRGFLCDAAENLDDAALMVRSAQYGAVLLDLGLPDGNGLDLLKKLRGEGSPIPIIALTARSGLDDRVGGLNAGADDYVTKPFEVDELVARLNAVLRRQGSLNGASFAAGNLTYDILSGDTQVEGVGLLLAARERQLLGLLLRRQGQVVSKQLAEDQLYGLADPIGSNVIEVHAYRLRRKLEAAQANVRIETIRGVGYLLRTIPAESAASPERLR